MSKRKLGQPGEDQYRHLTRKEVHQLKNVAAGKAASQTWIIGCRSGKVELMTGDWHNEKDRSEMLGCLADFWRDPAPTKMLATRLGDDLTEFVHTRAPAFGGVAPYIRKLIREDRARTEEARHIGREKTEQETNGENE